MQAPTFTRLGRARHTGAVAAGLLLALAAAQAAAAPEAGAAGKRLAVTWHDDTDISDYTPDTASLSRHKAPQWFSDAKLGTFITWGPYSVPAWAPKDGQSGNAYAEWYWSEMNRKDSPTYKHHRQTYGENFNYDDFLGQWKAAKFNPDEWLKLFKDGGSKYYVLVAKHHDGVALWDSKVSDRNTVVHGPKRDIVRALVDANDNGQYGLKNGVYFSMPEWYSPDEPVQWSGWFGRGAPKNPYTGAQVPYTGYKTVADWVKNYQYQQMNELVDGYDPDIVWCDIGGVNNSDAFMARYYNKAKDRAAPKDVVVDNRCGNEHHDFTTPEYSVEPDIRKSSWEASRGIGRSYGYNQLEDAGDYLTDKQLVTSFIDIVSKGGNLLLDVGPKADGTIPDLQAQRVRALGAWLRTNGEAVYGSSYWTQAEDKGANVPVRFTRQPKALYATATEWPGDQLVLSAPVDVAPGDEVRLLGHGKPLSWHRDAAGRLVVDMPAEGQAATPSKNAWTFRIAKPGYDPAKADLLDIGVRATSTKPGGASGVTLTLANRGDRPTVSGSAVVQPSWPGAKPVTVAVPALKPHQRMHTDFDLAVPASTAGGSATVTATATVRGEGYTGAGELRIVGESVPLNLAPARTADVIAGADDPQDTDFAGRGIGYPAEELPQAGPYTHDLVRYDWPSGAKGAKNAVLAADDRTVQAPEGKYASLDLLASAAYGPADMPVKLAYADGSADTVTVRADDWVTGAGDAPIRARYRWLYGKRDDGAVKVYGLRLPVDPAKQLASVTFRRASGPQGQAAAYVFAATLER